MSWRIHSLPAVDTGSADSASPHTGTSLLHWETPSVPSVKVMINNNHIERVYENKFQGVILDHKICWEPLIQHVRAKEARSIGVMGKARHFWNNCALYMLYCSLVLPYFNCCVEVWGNTYKITIQSLCTLQKRAIWILNHVGYCKHTKTLFLKLQTFKFRDVVEFRTAQKMYKASKKLLPGYIKRPFTEK